MQRIKQYLYFTLILLLIGGVSTLIVYAYVGFEAMQAKILNIDTTLTKIEELSNIYRNRGILFFGVFAGLLAIWARWAHQKQLEYTKAQINNSLAINRNDRYAKAVEMLEKDKSLISNKSALYILRDLIDETDKAESLRYSEAVADWLESGKAPPELVKLAKDILG